MQYTHTLYVFLNKSGWCAPNEAFVCLTLSLKKILANCCMHISHNNSVEPYPISWTWTWTWKKCLLDKKQVQVGNNVLNDTYRVFNVGRPLQRRWAHRWRKSHSNILQCINRHRAHEVLTFWEHEFGICNQNESTPLGKAPSRHTRVTQLT